jgi:hypothetical protein
VIHFFVDDSTDIEGLHEWIPDDDPTLFASGVGHNLLELHRRLWLMGRKTTVGPVIPSEATLVVFMPRPLLAHSRRKRFSFAWSMRRHRTIAVRSDLPPGSPQMIRVDLVIASSRAFMAAFPGPKMDFLPPLPQRGLICRDRSRGDQISVVGLKSNPENIPRWIGEPAFVERLDRLGLKIHVDAPRDVDGSDQSWHDFSEVDVVICARAEGLPTISKPATKLRNAWAAGVIPIASREPAYVEIANDGHDVLFFDNHEEIPALLGKLCAGVELRDQLRRGVTEMSSIQPSVDEVVDAWWKLFSENESAPSFRRSARSIAFMVWSSIRRFVGFGIGASK